MLVTKGEEAYWLRVKAFKIKYKFQKKKVKGCMVISCDVLNFIIYVFLEHLFWLRLKFGWVEFKCDLNSNHIVVKNLWFS